MKLSVAARGIYFSLYVHNKDLKNDLWLFYEIKLAITISLFIVCSIWVNLLSYLTDCQDALISFGVGDDAEETGFISRNDGVHGLPVLSVRFVLVGGFNPDRFHIPDTLLHTTLVLKTPHTEEACSHLSIFIVL